ncbi:hypothetical protein D3C85_1481900 [compost metagenome]
MIGFQVFARARAGIGQAMIEQAFDDFGIGVMAQALVGDIAIPFKAVVFQGLQDCCLGAGRFAGWVEVFHAQQPLAADSAGVEIGGEGGDQ